MATKHPDAPNDDRPVLGTFVLERALASGSFATTFLATQLGTERRAVVKIARRDRMAGPIAGHVREVFKNEARCATRVVHPNLVTVFATGDLPDGRPAIAMEHFDGETLRAFLAARAPLDGPELRFVFEPLADALESLHAADVQHGDLSPDNLLVRPGPPPTVKLLDFGLARIPEALASEVSLGGTWRYMAPEHMRGAPGVASDIYAFGALLWWALVGSELFAEEREMGPFVRRVLALTAAPDPRAHAPELEARVAELLMALLAPDPAARPAAAPLRLMLNALARTWAASPEQEENVHMTKTEPNTAATGRGRRVVTTRPLGAGPTAGAAPASNDDLRVLVVEPDRQVASAMLGLLVSFELDVASTLARALHILSVERFDVVLVADELLVVAPEAGLAALRRAAATHGLRTRFFVHARHATRDWQALGFDGFAATGATAQALAGIITAAPHPTPAAAPAPSMPQLPLWLVELEDGVLREDLPEIERVCALIVAEATRRGATRLVTRTEMLRHAALARRGSQARLLGLVLEEYEELARSSAS